MQIGSYRLEEELARGAMGVVYRARHVELGREVALKLLLGGRGDARARQRFVQEGQLLARLRHPHLLGIHEAGEAEGRPYLVLPLVSGASLQARLEQEGPLPPAEAVEVCACLADALEYAHQAGLLHRDVKPANVLLTRDGQPLLADFGLAKDLLAAEGALSRTGEHLGTPGYWSPEQATGQRDAVGPASDVYSLGATLYALLVGEPPFAEGSLLEMVGATVGRPAAAPSAARPEVGPGLDAVVLACLEKDPAARYPSAAALLDDLRRVARGEAPLHGPRPRGRAGPAAALALAGLAAAALLAAGLSRAGAPPPAPSPASSPPPASTPGDPLEPIRAALQAGDRAAARAALDRLCADPAAPSEALIESAALWLDLGDVDRAADELGRLGPAPREPRALALAASLELEAGRPEAAASLAARAIEAAPTDPSALCARGQVAWHQGEHERGLRDLTRAAEAGQPEAAALLGEALLEVGRLDAALAALEGAAPLRLRAAVAHALAARAVRGEAAAGAELEARVASDPQAPRAWAGRARLRLEAGDLQGAEADVARALELAPTWITALTLRAETRWSARRFTEALDDLARALELAPGRLDVRLSRAALRVSEQQFADAIADYDALLAARPGWGQVWGLRAYSRLGLSDAQGAIADLGRQLECEPDNATAWEHRGLIRRRAGDPSGALDDLDRAIELEPSQGRLLARSELHAALGHEEQAAADRAAAARFDPTASQAAPDPGRIERVEIMPR